MSGSERIAADKARVRSFLVDPAQVSACLPDLQEVTLVEDRHFVALVKVGVGAVRGRLKMDVTLTPGEADALRLELKGSGLGSALDMQSSVRLTATEPAVTELSWT